MTRIFPGLGIFKKPKEVDIVINLNGIPSLSETMVSFFIRISFAVVMTILFMTILAQVTESSLVVGGAVSLSNLIGLLQTNQGKSVTFEHLASHLLKVCYQHEYFLLFMSSLKTGFQDLL